MTETSKIPAISMPTADKYYVELSPGTINNGYDWRVAVDKTTRLVPAHDCRAVISEVDFALQQAACVEDADLKKHVLHRKIVALAHEAEHKRREPMGRSQATRGKDLSQEERRVQTQRLYSQFDMGEFTG